MRDSSHDEFPPELGRIAARLRNERAVADPLALDQIKGRVLRSARNRPRMAGSLKTRLATGFTLLALVGGSGGALAIAGSGGSGQVKSAASSQYKPPKKHHHHCRIDGHYYKNCPQRYKHHFHCYFRGRYWNNCPYGKHVKGVHAVRHRRHRHHVGAAFTG